MFKNREMLHLSELNFILHVILQRFNAKKYSDLTYISLLCTKSIYNCFRISKLSCLCIFEFHGSKGIILDG